MGGGEKLQYKRLCKLSSQRLTVILMYFGTWTNRNKTYGYLTTKLPNISLYQRRKKNTLGPEWANGEGILDSELLKK